jgi:hypothetical protein
MTGPELLAYLQRRLGEHGLAVESGRADELYDYLTEGRDELLAVFADVAPIVVKQTVTLEADGGDDRNLKLPDATKDPYRVLDVRAVTTREPLIPSAVLNQDDGHYVWRSIRGLRLGDGVNAPGGVEVDLVPHRGAITAATAEADVGLPTTCHRAVGKFAAVLALTADEESDASNARKLFASELSRLERLYGSYDDNGGAALRMAFMQSYGQWLGDTLY